MPVIDLDRERQTVELDAALEVVGPFRRGQQVQLALVGLSWLLAAVQTLTAVVWACLDPLRHLSTEVACTKPDDAACNEALAAGALCSLPREAWAWRAPGASLVSEWDMVCGRRWLLYFQSSLFFVATLAGCVLWQLSAERYGRRRLLYAGAMLCGLASVLASTAPSLWLYLVFRAASGAAMGGMGLAAYALAADVAGPSWRGSLGIFMNHFFSVGACVGTLLAWWLPASWRLLTFLAGLFCLAYIPTWSMVVESPQWLLLHGKKGEATAALAALALANGTRPPEHPLADPTALLGNTQRELKDVLASSRLRQRLALLGGAWFGAAAGYYGLMLLADGMSRGASGSDDSVYVTLLSAFAYEVPGVAAAGLAVERAGRKATGIAAFLQAGLCMVVAAVSGHTARRALMVAARFGLAAAFASLYLHTSELFPTVVREQGLAAANLFGRAGAAIAPLWAFLQFRLHSAFVPLLVLGCLCVAGGALTAMLPETLGERVPETIQEMNTLLNLRRKRSWRVALAAILRPGAGGGAGQGGLQSQRSASLQGGEAYAPVLNARSA